jgi:thermitase
MNEFFNAPPKKQRLRKGSQFLESLFLQIENFFCLYGPSQKTKRGFMFLDRFQSIISKFNFNSLKTVLFILLISTAGLFSLPTQAISLGFGFPVNSEADFNGYIVKLKPTENGFKTFADPQSILMSVPSVNEVVSTQFGLFAHVSTQQGVTQLKTQLQSTANFEVDYVERNYRIHIQSKKTSPPKKTLKDVATEFLKLDRLFEKQWALHNTGFNGTRKANFGGNGSVGSGKIGADINALNAWKLTKGDSTNPIKIAVIDTGIDYNHPELKTQMDVNEKELHGQKGVDDDGNGFVDDIYGYDFAYNDGDPYDGDGHGTHCAGVIGAAHNDKGMMGVMAHVKLVAIKFLDDDGNGDDLNAIKAIDYAIQRGVKVISNSWGGDHNLRAMEEAIDAANRAGIVFVVAAGNEGRDNDKNPTYPANYLVPNIISVGAHDSYGDLSEFSNYGKNTVHVLAPGTDIVSTFIGDSYESLSGTSMATPQVSGIVGLLLTLEPNLTPEQVRERLMTTSMHDIDDNHYFSNSGGRVDAFRALLNLRK